jgi:hypothetical protein
MALLRKKRREYFKSEQNINDQDDIKNNRKRAKMLKRSNRTYLVTEVKMVGSSTKRRMEEQYSTEYRNSTNDATQL